MRAVACIVCTLLSLNLAAQCDLTISGSLIATGDGHAVPFATVYEEENKKGVMADINGEFELSGLCPGHIHLSISHVNHESIRIQFEAKRDTTLVLRLAENPNMLATITIVGEEEQTDVGYAKTALSRSKLDHTSGKSIGESLEGISGVTSLKTGPGIAKPMIHGLYGNRIRMINNGIRQEGQQWGAEHAPEIDPFGADRLTVVKGASAVKYGSGAISGAVLVEPAPLPQDHHLHGEVNMVGMSNGRMGVGAVMVEGGSERLEALRWRLQGTVKAAGDFHAPNYYLTNTGIRESNLQATIGTRSQKLQTEFFYSMFRTTIGILRGSHIGNLTDLEDAITRDQPFFTNENFSYEINNPKQFVVHHLAKAKVLKYISDHNFLSATYAYQHNNRQEYDIRRGGRSEIPALDMTLPTHTFDATWHNDVSDIFISELGLRYTFSANTNNPDTGVKPLIPNYDSSMPGAYWVGTWRLSRVELEAGLGYDYQNLTVKYIDNGTVVSPRHQYHNYSATTGASWQMNTLVRYSGNIGLASRAPNVNELYSDGLHHGAAAIEIGDPDLNLEQSLKTIHTLTFSKHEKWGFEISGYYHHIDNFIYLKPQSEPRLTIRGAFPVYNYVQTDASIWGFDAGGRANVVANLFWETTFSTVHGTNRANDQHLLYMPADRWKNALLYTIPVIGSVTDIELKLTGLQVWEQKRTIMNSIAPGETYESELAYNFAIFEDYLPPPPGYFLTEFEAGLSLSKGVETLKFHVAMRNIFNVSYRDYLNRMRYYADDMGRNFEIRIKYQF